jgi:hypothetical protein
LKKFYLTVECSDFTGPSTVKDGAFNKIHMNLDAGRFVSISVAEQFDTNVVFPEKMFCLTLGQTDSEYYSSVTMNEADLITMIGCIQAMKASAS